MKIKKHDRIQSDTCLTHTLGGRTPQERQWAACKDKQQATDRLVEQCCWLMTQSMARAASPSWS